MVFLDKLVVSVNQKVALGSNSVIVKSNKFNLGILDCLEVAGYIRGYMKLGNSKVRIYLKYKNGTPLFRKLVRVSKSSRRVYSSAFFGDSQIFGEFVVTSACGIFLVSKSNVTQKVKARGGEVVLKIE